MDSDICKSNRLEFVVSDVLDGVRLDKALSALYVDLSRSMIQNLIGKGVVLLDGNDVKVASIKVRAGQSISLHVPEAEPAIPQAEDIPLDVLFEDKDVIVINKPAGLVVHPGAGNWSGTLVNALLYHCGDSLSGIGGVVRPGIVHRLDKDTSGVMIAAKNDAAHKSLSEQLAERTLSRVYHALVLGVPMPIKGKVDLPVDRNRRNRLKMAVVNKGGRHAVTHYHMLQDFFGACSLVKCSLETGRTHQIRVHMEALGYPILGDLFYGPQQTQVKSTFLKAGYDQKLVDLVLQLKRQMLHAKAIEFVHPRTNDLMKFECELSDDFSKLLNKIDK